MLTRVTNVGILFYETQCTYTDNVALTTYACHMQAMQQSIDISCHWDHSSKPATMACSGRMGRTGRHTDGQIGRCPINVGSANKLSEKNLQR